MSKDALTSLKCPYPASEYSGPHCVASTKTRIQIMLALQYKSFVLIVFVRPWTQRVCKHDHKPLQIGIQVQLLRMIRKT